MLPTPVCPRPSQTRLLHTDILPEFPNPILYGTGMFPVIGAGPSSACMPQSLPQPTGA